MSTATPPPPSDSMSGSLNDIARIFRVEARKAAAQARAFLKRYPGQRQALVLLVSAHRLAGDLPGARSALLEMAEDEPGVAAVHYELALLFNETGEHESAIAALSLTIALEPQHAQAWRALGDALAASGNATDAAKAYAKYIEFVTGRMAQLEAQAYGDQTQLPRAERLLRARLARDPTDLSALVLLASVYVRLGRHVDAKQQLRHALALAPEFAPARKLATAAANRRLS